MSATETGEVSKVVIDEDEVVTTVVTEEVCIADVSVDVVIAAELWVGKGVVSTEASTDGTKLLDGDKLFLTVCVVSPAKTKRTIKD